MASIIFEQDAFEDFSNWAIIHRSTFKKIVELIKDISRHKFEGIGKPEPLRRNLKGNWSRRITKEHRLVYKVTKDGNVKIVSCRGHYN